MKLARSKTACPDALRPSRIGPPTQTEGSGACARHPGRSGLMGSQRVLHENEVDDTDDVVDVSAFGGFGGDPSFDQPFDEIEEAID